MNKRVNFLFASVVLCLVSYLSFAQDRQPSDTARIEDVLRDESPFGPNLFNYVSWQDNMMGASPEAAKMTKYADTPVSNAYGLAEIGIPIYTVQSRSLRLPITLTYDSSGIKPEEISGIVGLGWSLQAGGVITRSVIGREDTGNTIPPETHTESDAEWLAIQANSSGRDSAYDLYSYNFCGHSGSFYIIPGAGIVPLEPTELVISQANGFTITDKDGTQYKFTRSETSTRYMGSDDPNAPLAGNTGNYYGLITAWYLTEIRSMDGKEVITISYQQLPEFSHVSHSYYRSISFPYKYMGNGVWLTNLSGGIDPTPQFTTLQWSFTTTNTWHPYVVDTITFNGGTVSFGYEGYGQGNGATNTNRRSYPSFLSSITVKDTGQNTLFSWSFTKSTSGDYRTLLATVTQKGSNGSTIEKWTCTYDSPNTDMGENSVDLFGFYNGSGNAAKAFLRPYNDESTVAFSVADRNHNSAYVGMLSLQSITTASGNRTKYNYASNEYPTQGYSNLFVNIPIRIGQRVSRIDTYDLSKGTEQLVRRRDFSYSSPGITIPEYAFQMGAYISTTEYNTCVNGINSGHWYGSDSPVRTASIVYNDQSNLPGMPLESARVFYQQVIEDVSDGGVTSVVRTKWEYNGTGAVSTGGGGTVWAPSDSHDDSLTTSLGIHCHQRVPTYIPRNGSQSYPTTPLGYHIQNQNRPQLGNPTKITQYKKNASGQFTPVSQTDFTYESDYVYLQEGLTLTLRTSPNTNGHENTNIHCLSDVDQQQVDRKIYYQRLRERIDKEYLDDNTIKSVKTTYHYDYTPGGRSSFYSGNTYYSNPTQVPAMGALQSPRQEVQVYDNDASRTHIRNVIYPDELANLTGYSWAASLNNLHYHVPVGEEIIIGASPSDKAGRYITWSQIPVASWTNGVSNMTLLKPHTMEVYRNGYNVGPTVTYSLYDATGCPLEIQAQGQPVKTYAWGYNHRFPIAEMLGKSFADVRAVLGSTARSRMDGIANASTLSPTSTDMQFVRSVLRTQQPDAMTTLHTYIPPYGLGTEEDPSGRMIQYAYDMAGRLASIKDENGNVRRAYVYALTNGGSGSPNKIESQTYTSSSAYIRDIVYYDGLGRTVQQIAVGAARFNKDLVTPVVPDFLDREDARDYLPYPASGAAGSYRSAAIAGQQSYYGSGVKSYTENTYELSRRNRVTASSLPGFTETTTSTIAASPSNLVLKLTYSPSTNKISANGYYPAARFKLTVTEGPDGSRTESYTDEFETPYLERVKLDASGTYACTYYIRDVWGRVVCVVPPAEAEQLTATTAGFDAGNCYSYVYDNRDRVVRRWLPGRFYEEYTYNNADQPLTRTRLASDAATNEVFTTTYDGFNRPAKEEYRYGSNTAVTLAEYFYDSYPTGAPSFSAESGYVTTSDKDSRTKGLKTAERITLLPANVAPSALTTSNTNTKAFRAFYYDYKGNVVQQAENNVFGGVNRISSKYGYANTLLEQRQRIAPGSGLTSSTLDHRFSYDSRMRPDSVIVQLNGGEQGLLKYLYDDLQRVRAVNRWMATDELTQYTYTLQGWLSSAVSDSWEETLRYESPSRTATDALPGKVGFITEWTSKQKGTSSNGETTSDTYAFSYDKAGRLTASTRYVESSTAATNLLTERDITYDKNGNLLTLNRYGASSTTAPTASLSYTYNGPKRTGWTYDPNGNVTSDTANGVSISWNVIDQPRMLSSSSQTAQRYYLADGTLAYISNGTQQRIYLGDMVFTQSSGNPALESVCWEGGLLLAGTGTDRVLYFVKDHLGSVRTVKDGTGAVKQRFDYYPYGAVSRSWSSGAMFQDPVKRRFRFGGKEIAGTAIDATLVGSATYLDFGARLYSPGTVTWMSQDSMAEKYYPIGPHVYCAGNPIRFIDPTGETWFQNSITGELYYNKDFSPFDVGRGYMSDNPNDWAFLANDDAFCISDLYLTATYAEYDGKGGFVFNVQQSERAMNAVGFKRRPMSEIYEITRHTEYYPEGLSEITQVQEEERLIKTERWAYCNKNYYQSVNVERNGSVSHQFSSLFPRRYTIDTWAERRVYSYSPEPSKKDKTTPLFKEILFEVFKALAQGWQ